MLIHLAVAWALMAICVTIHAVGLAWAMRWLRRAAHGPQRFLAYLRLFIRVAVLIVMLHLAEILAWALLYTWRGALPDLTTAMYFSAVTYTTTGTATSCCPKVGGCRAVSRR